MLPALRLMYERVRDAEWYARQAAKRDKGRPE
jgi:hypothetical protein